MCLFCCLVQAIIVKFRKLYVVITKELCTKYESFVPRLLSLQVKCVFLHYGLLLSKMYFIKLTFVISKKNHANTFRQGCEEIMKSCGETALQRSLAIPCVFTKPLLVVELSNSIHVLLLKTRLPVEKPPCVRMFTETKTSASH